MEVLDRLDKLSKRGDIASPYSVLSTIGQFDGRKFSLNDSQYSEFDLFCAGMLAHYISSNKERAYDLNVLRELVLIAGHSAYKYGLWEFENFGLILGNRLNIKFSDTSNLSEANSFAKLKKGLFLLRTISDEIDELTATRENIYWRDISRAVNTFESCKNIFAQELPHIPTSAHKLYTFNVGVIDCYRWKAGAGHIVKGNFGGFVLCVRIPCICRRATHKPGKISLRRTARYLCSYTKEHPSGYIVSAKISLMDSRVNIGDTTEIDLNKDFHRIDIVDDNSSTIFGVHVPSISEGGFTASTGYGICGSNQFFLCSNRRFSKALISLDAQNGQCVELELVV